MPKAKKTKLPANGPLSTYNDVKDLSAADLNKYCKQVGLDTTLPKQAKIILLCLCLNISTTSGNKENAAPWKPRSVSYELTRKQSEEFAALRPEQLVRLSGWSKDLQCMPDVDDTKVKLYLKDTREITPEMSRQYKTTRPFKMKQFVHSMYIHSLPDQPTFVAMRAQCNPSQSTEAGNVKVCFAILDRITGEPVAGFCTCRVG